MVIANRQNNQPLNFWSANWMVVFLAEYNPSPCTVLSLMGQRTLQPSAVSPNRSLSFRCNWFTFLFSSWINSPKVNALTIIAYGFLIWYRVGFGLISLKWSLFNINPLSLPACVGEMVIFVRYATDILNCPRLEDKSPITCSFNPSPFMELNNTCRF